MLISVVPGVADVDLDQHAKDFSSISCSESCSANLRSRGGHSYDLRISMGLSLATFSNTQVASQIVSLVCTVPCCPPFTPVTIWHSQIFCNPEKQSSALLCVVTGSM